MSTIIKKSSKKIIVTILFLIMLPVILYIQELIFTFGQITGTSLRMYTEGVCVK